MNQIVLDCRGRLANLLLCWANARHVTEQLGLTDRTIVVNYAIPEDRLILPGAVVKQMDVSHLPRVTRHFLKEFTEGCLWDWNDLFSAFPPDMDKIIRTIGLTPAFESALTQLVGRNSRIGIHARFGDYVKIDRSRPPVPLPPFIRDPDEYFTEAMKLCADAFPGIGFFLASDGTPDELEFLTRKPGVMRQTSDDPVFDLFALSRCKLIIGSRSTFSAVAAIYGNVPLIQSEMSVSMMKDVIERAKL